jgi:hypothetical protein
MPDGSATSQESIFFRRAISSGSGMALPRLRSSAADLRNESWHPLSGSLHPLAFVRPAAQSVAPAMLLPGEAAFTIALAEGVGLIQFKQRLLMEGVPPAPPIIGNSVGSESARTARETSDLQAFAAVHCQPITRLFADLDGRLLTNGLGDSLAPAADR